MTDIGTAVCAICRSRFLPSDEDKPYRASCGHVCHLSCLQSSRSSGADCPYCLCPVDFTTVHPVFLRWEEEVLDSWIESQTQAAVSPLKAERDQLINRENDLKLKLDGLHAHITVMEDLQASGQQGRAADETLEESLAEQRTGLLGVKRRADAKIRHMQEKLADLQRQRIELEASVDRSESAIEET